MDLGHIFGASCNKQANKQQITKKQHIQRTNKPTNAQTNITASQQTNERPKPNN
jgi:hypothetical protein